MNDLHGISNKHSKLESITIDKNTFEEGSDSDCDSLSKRMKNSNHLISCSETLCA